MIFVAMPLAGCDVNDIVLIDGPQFCDVEEPRVFPSQEVIDYRLEHDRENIKKDLKTNTTGERECGWEPVSNG